MWQRFHFIVLAASWCHGLVCGAGEGTEREGEGRRGDGTLLLKIIIIIYIIVIVSGHNNTMLTPYPVLTASNWRSLALLSLSTPLPRY